MIAEIIIAAAVTYAVSPNDNAKTIALSESGGMVLLDESQKFPDKFCIKIMNNDDRRMEFIVRKIGNPQITYKAIGRLAPLQSASVEWVGNSWKIKKDCGEP